MAINYIIVGRRVKESRLQKGISQADLAEQINMSVSYISRIETAKKQASLEALVRISDALDVTMDHLLKDNQANDSTDYDEYLTRLMVGCTNCERRIIYEIAFATKRSLGENRWNEAKTRFNK